ncbi:hypothetical protein PUR34_06230 [Streptomyces sp. JV185]|uniref:hypothetical protein n=1 Tax=Streptomyces sp. JV185 TaxID=858638 RepID=UPI002E79E752|nr:hypothetical protein [Streptomyces sp. JV185]MEE1767785.1 hypothetical protein [Streptomyces sp. JV185]
MSTDECAAAPEGFQPGDSLTGSAWPAVLAATAPIATAVATVAKSRIEQRGETERAVISADVERERMRRPELPPGGGADA